MTEVSEKTLVDYSTDLLPLYNVVFHNDNKTTFDFVIMLLISVFEYSFVEAYEISVKIHNEQAAIVGSYPLDLAESRKEHCLSLAKKYNFPFKVTVEPQ